jgi:thioredoxin-related protein
VNRLKIEFPFRLQVVSVDVQSPLGRELTREYGRFTPTFVFFNADGEELWRAVGTLDPNQVRQSIKN